jgi:16S rRNA G1207 methylase RsmC
MQLTHQDHTYHLRRYPPTSNRSLQPVSAADELLLAACAERNPEPGRLAVAHDRFGALATCLHAHRPLFVAGFRSQERALALNLRANDLSAEAVTIHHPLDELPPVELALLRVPKSLDLFELYLAQLTACAEPGAKIIAGFMTRHFTPGLLEVAGRYAGHVEQSRAHKKARLLHLRNLRTAGPRPGELRRTVAWEGRTYEQYYGVFSADHIDYATQFLLAQCTPAFLRSCLPAFAESEDPAPQLLDLACGNGVIGEYLLRMLPEARLTATDDSFLAVASAQLNLPADRATVHYADDLGALADRSIDLAVTNPPFHFGHENNIEVSLGLFRQVRRVLRPGGSFLVVANRHLNYATHLGRLFPSVETVGESEKFVVYRVKG